MDNPLRDLSAITSESQSITLRVRGKEVEVCEVTMDKLSAFITACAPFLSAFDQLSDVKEASEGTVTQEKKVDDKFGFFKLIADNASSFLDAAALVTEVEGGRVFLSRLRPDEFFHIALAVVEVNGDFFILRLAPALQKFLGGVGRIGMSRINVLSEAATTATRLTATGTASSPDSVVH